jgi:hypothetical protein
MATLHTEVEELAKYDDQGGHCLALLTIGRSFIDDSLVSIELEDGGNFKLQKAILCKTSDYFRKALCGEFQESSTKKLRISGCTTNAFQLIIYWICNGNLPSLAEDMEKEPTYDLRSVMAASLQLRLTQLWLAGDMLLMTEMQNYAMTQLRSLILEYPLSPDALGLAFETVPPESPLCRALIHQAGQDFLRYPHTYSSDDFAAFGRIPGFFAAFISSLRTCGTKPDSATCAKKHNEHVRLNIDLDDDQKFYVPEIAQSGQDE